MELEARPSQNPGASSSSRAKASEGDDVDPQKKKFARVSPQFDVWRGGAPDTTIAREKEVGNGNQRLRRRDGVDSDEKEKKALSAASWRCEPRVTQGGEGPISRIEVEGGGPNECAQRK